MRKIPFNINFYIKKINNITKLNYLGIFQKELVKTNRTYSFFVDWEKVKQNWRQRQVTKRELCWGGPCEPREPHVVEIETNIESEKKHKKNFLNYLF